MSKPDLGRIIAQTMAAPVEGRTIETITDEILELKQTAGEAILEIGNRLIEAQSMLSHGEWLTWLTERVEFSPRTAQRFMRLSREWSNATALSHLGATKALALLALPADEREQFMTETHQVDGQEKTIIDMSARQLEQAIKERDEARKAAEAAKADASAAEQARAKMEEDMIVTQNLLESARADADSAGSRARALEEKLRMLQEKPVEVAVETVVDQDAIDKARAEAVAEMQAKLEKAKEAKAKADEKRKNAEASVEILKKSIAEMERNEKKAALGSDKDVAQFEVLFNQGQELANKMRGLLLKARGREDLSAAQMMEKSLVALGDAVKNTVR